MKTVVFYTKNAAFKFDKKKVTERLNSCEKIYTAGQLKEIAIGHGISPFSINQKQKGGFSLFKKRKNPSMFGGKGFTCPEDHTLISMETWRT